MLYFFLDRNVGLGSFRCLSLLRGWKPDDTRKSRTYPLCRFRGGSPRDRGRKNHENDDKHRFEGFDRFGANLKPQQSSVQHFYRIRAYDGAGDAELASAQRVPSNRYREYCVHFNKSEQIDAVMPTGFGNRYEPCNSGTDAKNDVGEKFYADRIYTVEARGFLIDTDTLGIEFEIRDFEKDRKQKNEHNSQQYRCLNGNSGYDAAYLVGDPVRQYGRQPAIDQKRY